MSLLEQHCPVFFHDRHEKEELMNLNLYAENDAQVADRTCTGCVVHQQNLALLHYFFFYARDDGMKKLGLFVISSHRFDLEHVVVELTDGSVTGVCYMPHGTGEHFWIRGHDLKDILVNGTRPKVYASRGKHASYPIPGVIRRYGNLANDHHVPLEFDITVEPASQKLMSIDLIDNAFPAIKGRLNRNLSQYPTIPLNKVRTHLLFKIPIGTRQYLYKHKVVVGCFIILIATLAVALPSALRSI
jgi:hypothetical protein